MTTSPPAASTEKKFLSVDATDSLHNFCATHHVNRSNMRDTSNQTTKPTIAKAGSNIRSRSSAFSSANLLGLPRKFGRPSSPTSYVAHHINRSTMRDTVSKSTKLTITKVGSSIRSRSSAFSSANLLRLPPKLGKPSSPTDLLNKPTQRRIVSFEVHTPTEESNEPLKRAWAISSIFHGCARF
jgi:hypothetical protein